MIQIHDSKKKGDYSIKEVRRNGKITGDHQGFSSTKAVDVNLVSKANTYITNGSDDWKSTFRDLKYLLNLFDTRDHTKSQHWTKKYGCKSGLKKA